MHAIAAPAVAEPFAGGFYAGKIQIDRAAFALIVAPRSEGGDLDEKHVP